MKSKLIKKFNSYFETSNSPRPKQVRISWHEFLESEVGNAM